jgi:4-hydroxymandelate oxidase
LVLTVDAQLWGERERDARNRFRLPDGLEMSNLFAGKRDFPANVSGSGLAAYVSSMFDPSLSWKDLAWLRSISPLPILVKGVVHPDDAVLAAEHGAAGVIVSNHGGRQVDTAPATIEVLPEICAAVDGRIEVHVDGGIRRGSDVVKALALGARAVGIGRPALWGLAVGGQEGVESVLAILRREFDAVVGLCGAARLADLGPDLVMRPAR